MLLKYKQLIASHVWIHWTDSRTGSKCSCLFRESLQQQQRVDSGWRHNGQTGPEGWAALPLWTLDMNQKPSDHDGGVGGGHCRHKSVCAHSLRGETTVKLTVVPSHVLLTAAIYIQDNYPPPLASTSLSQTCTHTHLSTHFPGRCESVYSFGRGQLHTWWQPRMVVLAVRGGVGGWGVGCQEGEGCVYGPTGLSFRVYSTCTFQFIKHWGKHRNVPSCEGSLLKLGEKALQEDA